MKPKKTLIFAGSLGALFALAHVAPSQQTRGGQPFDYADNEGWVSLFDGQTLNGWDGDPRFWGVKDGAIYVEPTCEKPTGTIYHHVAGWRTRRLHAQVRIQGDWPGQRRHSVSELHDRG